MIYQHRLVISRGGRLDQRNAAFKSGSLATLNAHGSLLIGAWEVWLGPDTGSSVFQLRQFDSMTAWARHQESVALDASNDQRRGALFPNVDFCDTAILRTADSTPPLPSQWPEPVANTTGAAGIFEQRTIWLRPGTASKHHQLYCSEVLPALEREYSKVIGFFDTVIGPGTTNAGSHRSIELRRFPDMAAWQQWREELVADPALRRLTRETWPAHTERIDSLLLRPTDYSLIR